MGEMVSGQEGRMQRTGAGARGPPRTMLTWAGVGGPGGGQAEEAKAQTLGGHLPPRGGTSVLRSWQAVTAEGREPPGTGCHPRLTACALC